MPTSSDMKVHPRLAGVDPKEVIDRSGPIPLHYQLERFLREGIKTGHFPANESLPTEQDLQDYFGLSRTPVRQAIGQLVTLGLVVRRRSRGTIVLPGLLEENRQLLSQFMGFTDEVLKRGGVPRARVLKFEVLPADGQTSELLGVEAEAEVFRIRRIRYVDGAPVALVTSQVPVSVAPDLRESDLEEEGPRQSLYNVLATVHGLQPVRAVETVEASSLDPQAAHQLGLPANSPILARTCTTFDARERAILLDFGLFRTRKRFIWELAGAGRTKED